MPRAPDRRYLERIAAETDFTRDTLEKVFRLLELLKAITAAPGIKGKLALKGGTALQFIHLGLRRLSVDIDFNYVGSVDRGAMLDDRKAIGEMMPRIFREFGYELEEIIDSHAEEQNILLYTNCVGNRDRLKVELNYLERLPVLPIVAEAVKHPFETIGPVSVPVFQYEELIAQKTRALITRATPRDLYDIYLFSSAAKHFDWNLYRKLTIFYLCLAKDDVRKIDIGKIEAVTRQDIRRHLVPMLRKREYEVDLSEIRGACLDIAERIMKFTDSEAEFLDIFYDERKFDQEMLFGAESLTTDLNKHPGVVWRLQA